MAGGREGELSREGGEMRGEWDLRAHTVGNSM